MSIQSVLRPEQEKWLADVREHLTRLLIVLAKSGVSEREDEETVRDSVRQLEDLFLLVVVGEFNAGKSVFVNALIGAAILDEGVLPTTTRVQILRYGDTQKVSIVDEALQVIEAPIALLRDISIVDTPGTNAIERKHEAITQDFIPKSELVFFVTSADRPFTESERAFMERVRAWGKKIIVIVNKVDILEKAEDTARLQAFVSENAIRLLGFQPDVFPVSAREALRAKLAGNPVPAGFDSLERYVIERLDSDERVRLKLLSPLGVCEHIIGKHIRRIEGELSSIQTDLANIEAIESRLSIYKRDMADGFRLRLVDIENALHQMEARGQDFIEDTVRVGRVFDLMKRDKMKTEFEQQVVGETPRVIEQRVDAIIDWLVASELQQWQIVHDHVERRRTELSNRAAGEMNRGFEYDRKRLIDTLGRAAQLTMASYDHRSEASRMAESVRSAVANAAVIEVGAVGLGTLVTIAASSTAADITGLVAASVLATIGFLVIPQKRRAARKELREKIAHLRQQLMSALTSHFGSEIERSVQRMNEGILPYTQFVRAEHQRLEGRLQEFATLRASAASTRRAIQP